MTKCIFEVKVGQKTKWTKLWGIEDHRVPTVPPPNGDLPQHGSFIIVVALVKATTFQIVDGG